MRTRNLTIPVLAVFLVLLAMVPLLAATEPDGEKENTIGHGEFTLGKSQKESRKELRKQPWDQKPSVTRHSITVAGRSITYTATAGYMPLSDESGNTSAYVFYVSYTADGGDEKSRPLTFAFNGGPGAASVWLHMAALGPVRVVLSREGKGVSPPYTWVTNEETWLEFTDLVFIDPVGTGFSRPAEGVKIETFLGVQKDIEAVAQFIRLYTTRNGRWLSPKYLAGESYGTTRAAGLSKYLQDRTGMALQGIVLISTVLNFQSVVPGPENDLFYGLLLPAYTAAALYHGKLSPPLMADPARTREEAERFALGEYLPALSRGHGLSHGEKERMVEKLSLYTGMKPLTIRNSNLRIERRVFARELLEERGLRLGQYDSRFTGSYRYDQFMEDPSMFEVTAPMLSVCNDYLRRELKWETDLPYEFLADRVYHQWSWGSAEGGYVDTASSLAMAMSQNRFLHVFMAGGYYDLVTSYFAAKYTYNRMGPDEDLRRRIKTAYYDGGHQLYMDPSARRGLKKDGMAFYREISAGGYPAPISR